MKQIPNKLIKLENNQFRWQDIFNLNNIKFSKILPLSQFSFFSSLYTQIKTADNILGSRDNKKLHNTTNTYINVNTPDKSI